MTNLLFSQLELPEKIAQAIEAMGFETATPVQAKTIPIIRAGVDIIAKSQTGTGKTLAFAVPMLELIDASGGNSGVQVLILCPTRELAQQAADEIRKLAKFMPSIFPAEVYGGTNMERQFISLRRANIVVGTPGRVMDHLRRKTLKLDNLSAIVLDEADEMLNMGFKEDIETILKYAPETRQTVLFSATMPPDIMALAKQFQRDPQTIEIDRGQITIENIDQCCVDVPKEHKIEALAMLIEFHRPNRALVFCNTKRMVDELAKYLTEQGFSAEGIHGDLNQAQRTRVMTGFKAGRISILVATDVAARGIDVNDLDYVFNYDIPMTTEYYVHRIGRTGRAGKTGNALTICCGNKQLQVMQRMAREVKSTIRRDNLPILAEFHLQEQGHNAEIMEKAIIAEQNPAHQALLEELLKRGHSIENIAAAALAECFPIKKRKSFAFADKHRTKLVKNISDMKNITADGYTDLLFSIGKSHHVAPNHLVGAIAESTGISGKKIGKIQIYMDRSIVQIPTPIAQEIIDSMNGCKICGRATKVSLLTAAPEWQDKKPKSRKKPSSSRSGHGAHGRSPSGGRTRSY